MLQCAVFPALLQSAGWCQAAEVQAPRRSLLTPWQAQRQREAQAGRDIDGAVLRTLEHKLEDQLLMSPSFLHHDCRASLQIET